MGSKAGFLLRWSCILGAFLLLSLPAFPQGPASGEQASGPGAAQSTGSNPNVSSKLDVTVQDETGGQILAVAVVTLKTAEGTTLKQASTEGGRAEFDGLAPGRYTLHIVAEGFDLLNQTVTVAGLHSVANVQLRRSAIGIDQSAVSTTFGTDSGMYMQTAVKEQRQILGIAQALRDNKPQKARMDLEKLTLEMPNDGNLAYLYGLYEMEMKDLPKAKFYWQKAVGIDSKNLAALMELGHAALDEGKPAEALPYLKRAAQVSPTSWHPHALMVVAYSLQKQYDDAVKEAERALELGHSQAAAAVQPTLASTLARGGNRERAIEVLEGYLKDHSDDASARSLLAALRKTGAPLPAGANPEVVAASMKVAPLLPGGRTSDVPQLSPEGQKLLANAAEALREHRVAAARSFLAELHHLAPGDPDVNYVFGVCASQSGDWESANKYWQKAIDIDPRHVGALMELGRIALRENRAGEAAAYFRRAIDAQPGSWPPHAMMAQALTMQGQYSGAVDEADRALGLGSGYATAVEPLLAEALAKEGDKPRAINVLRSYPKDRSDSAKVQEFLKSLEAPGAPAPAGGADPPGAATVLFALDLPPLLPGVWRPPDVDDGIPPVQFGVPCSLQNVLGQASKRVVELVETLDRFAATETLVHERIGRNGLPIAAESEARKFEYVVSIGEIRPGLLHVDEYRGGEDAIRGFPDNLITSGLPGLVMVFHPTQAPNFDFTCEGLSHSTAGLAWQVRFQQKQDHVPTLQAYTEGGHTVPLALKGRAWIAADSFEVVRLESDLVRPLPDLQLKSEHTVIEYGPVQFRQKKVSLWLPQSAEVYFDWHGKLIDRRHSFSNFLLFSVDNNQKISRPKNAEAVAPDSSAASAPAKPN